ncbi:GspH/FimT family pseudopilin [bacterium]|nr:GspH/FimT family pseudopilin [bacterium]
MTAEKQQELEITAEGGGDGDGGDSGDKGFFRGFSLIELMLVIAIISILTAIAFISMLHYGLIIRVNASARDLAGHMRLARAAAIRDGRPNLFTFAGRSYSYGTDSDTNGVFDGGSRTNSLQDGVVFGYESGTPQVPGHPAIASAIMLQGPCASTGNIHFQRDGTVNCGGVVYMIPSRDDSGTGQRGDRQRAVDWSAQSGRIRMWKYFPSEGGWR